MLSLAPTTRIFLCVTPIDIRRSFDTLAGLVRNFLGEDPMSGHLFVFRNREEDKVKMLWWDRDGYAIFYKRLEKGTFAIPESVAAGVEMDSTTLSLLLSGINLERVRKQDRYTNGARKERAKIASNLPGDAEQRSTKCDWLRRRLPCCAPCTNA